MIGCSPTPVTKPPAFNVMCLSRGDTLFASDSVFAYSSPEQKWGVGDHEWLFAINVSHWRVGPARNSISSAIGEIIQVSGDCVVKRNKNGLKRSLPRFYD